MSGKDVMVWDGETVSVLPESEAMKQADQYKVQIMERESQFTLMTKTQLQRKARRYRRKVEAGVEPTPQYKTRMMVADTSG